ncbi:hypothetical protein [Nocardia fusca]|uniref:Lsr2 protein n=1 Tax=Nocardia fusca TaxID=941183 RepID=A0ABV3FJ36_9NOCA
MSRLTCYVYVTDDTGSVHGFGPDSVVPDWARKKITNPHVWDSATEQPEPVAVVVGAGGGGGEGKNITVESADGPPPQGGTGATRQRWADYASSKGVEVRGDWKREDIIAACEKAGVPV